MHAPEHFGRDSTVRWSTRAGDYVLWVRCTNIFSRGEGAFSILDFWELRDGDYLTITNRLADLPPGFDLHPTETQGSLAYRMMQRLQAGHQPGPPMDGPHLWRALSGDRLVWVGESRDGLPAHDHVLALLDFRQNALVAGSSPPPGNPFGIFGTPTHDEPTPRAESMLHAGFQAAVSGGVPRTLGTSWALA